MTNIPTALEIDCSTGIETLRTLTSEELAQREADVAAYTAAEAERTASAEALAALKASAKAKLISGQPLTAEEADTLVI